MLISSSKPVEPRDDYQRLVTETKNSANLHQTIDDIPEEQYDYDAAIKKYWQIFNYAQYENYTKGVAAGKYAGWDSKCNDNPYRFILKMFQHLVRENYRIQNKSMTSINFLLDILDTTLDNMDYIIEQDKMKTSKQEVISFAQGFTTGLLNQKSIKTNE